MTVDRTLLAAPFDAWAEQVEALGFFARGLAATEDQVKAALRFDLASCGVDTVDPETFALAAAGMAVGMKAMLVAALAPGAVSVPAVIAHQVALGRLMIGLADEPAADLSGLDWEPASWPSLDPPDPKPLDGIRGAFPPGTEFQSIEHPCADCGQEGMLNYAGAGWLCGPCWLTRQSRVHPEEMTTVDRARGQFGLAPLGEPVGSMPIPTYPRRPSVGGPSFQRSADNPPEPYLTPEAPQRPPEPSGWRKAVLGAVRAVEKALGQ